MFILHTDHGGVNASQCPIELGYNVKQGFCVVLNECRLTEVLWLPVRKYWYRRISDVIGEVSYKPMSL